MKVEKGSEKPFIRVVLDGAGYSDMMHEMDQVAEAWTKGRVVDSTWEDVREAVAAALDQHAVHAVPADEENPDWVRAMAALEGAQQEARA